MNSKSKGSRSHDDGTDAGSLPSSFYSQHARHLLETGMRATLLTTNPDPELLSQIKLYGQKLLDTLETQLGASEFIGKSPTPSISLLLSVVTLLL